MTKWFATIFSVFSRRISRRILLVLRFLSSLTSPARSRGAKAQLGEQGGPNGRLAAQKREGEGGGGQRTDSLLLPLHLAAVLLLRLQKVEELAAHLKQDVVLLLAALDLHLLEVLVLTLPLRGNLLLRGIVVGRGGLRLRGWGGRLLGGHLFLRLLSVCAQGRVVSGSRLDNVRCGRDVRTDELNCDCAPTLLPLERDPRRAGASGSLACRASYTASSSDRESANRTRLGVVCAVGWIAWCGGGFLAWCGSTHIKRRPRACGGGLAASCPSPSPLKVQPVALE
jgi:hypothetical protein